MTTPTDDLAQALRELSTKWRSQGEAIGPSVGHLARTYCADDLDELLEAHESRAQPASVSSKPVPIPISAGEGICKTYGYDQVVIMARKVGDGGIEHVTTYGVNKTHCDVAARMGYTLKYKIMGWDDRMADPSESRPQAQPASVADNRHLDLIEQLCRDLSQAHDELMRAQGIGDKVATLDWPEWTPQANSIRMAERVLGKRLAKTNAWSEFKDAAPQPAKENDHD